MLRHRYLARGQSACHGAKQGGGNGRSEIGNRLPIADLFPQAFPHGEAAATSVPALDELRFHVPWLASRAQRSAPSAAHRVQPNPKTPDYTQSRLPATLQMSALFPS